MKRRSFLKSSLLGASLGSMLPVLSRAGTNEAAKKQKREFYELRVYTLKNKEQEKIIEGYFEKAAIPALNSLGSKSIGVFKDYKPEGQSKIYVIIPFRSLDDFTQVAEKLSGDRDYQEAGAEYLNAPMGEPAYESMESSLHIAFVRMPKLALPEKAPRIFELRRYESANEMAGKKKIEMFNEAGEIEICKRVGMNPVFFGETLIGAARPNLVYMLSYSNMASHDRAWKGLQKDQQWKQLKAMPDYSEEQMVSKVTSTFLVPVACSQV